MTIILIVFEIQLAEQKEMCCGCTGMAIGGMQMLLYVFIFI